MKDYFKILGVAPDAGEDEIRTAYRRLAMQHHPDRGGDQAVFQDVQEAYSTLTDSQKRAQWEQQKHFDQHGNQGFSFQFNFGGGDPFQDILRQFHGHHFGNQFRPQRNKDIKVLMELDLESTLNTQVKYVEIAASDGSRKTVQVDIPKGIQSKMQIRFPGHGERQFGNLPPGDMYVEFFVKPHPDFKISGLNLHKHIRLNAIEAILGTTIDILGLDNKHFQISIPAGTQPGTQMRLVQQGLWDINHPVRGDLLVEIIIDIPRNITSDQLRRLQNLL